MKLTAREFLKNVHINPKWGSTITVPTEVTETVFLWGPIQCLSPLLTFSGQDEQGNSANFYKCENLEIAEGTFHGNVAFTESGIETIGELHITQPNQFGEAATFFRCRALKIAKGSYPGHVNFNGTGVTHTEDLEILQANKDGHAVSFIECNQLGKIRGNFNGKIHAKADLIAEYQQHIAIKKASKTKMAEPALEL